MPWYLRLMQRRLMEEAGDDGSAGGAAGGSDPGSGGDPGAGAGGGSGDPGAAGGDKGGKGDKGGPTDREAQLLRETMERKEEIRKLKDRFKDVDPDKYRAFITAEEKRKADEAEAERKAAEARGEFDRVKAQMVEAHTAELTGVRKEIETLKGEMAAREALINELTVGNAFGTSSFITQKSSLPVAKARLIYGSYFEHADGKVVAYDKPAGAKDRTLLVDGKGEALNFESAIQKLIESDPDKDSLLKSTVRTGAGSGSKPNAGASAAAGSGEIQPGRSRIIAAVGELRKASKK